MTLTARPTVVSADEWEQARAELLVEEKKLTRQQDAVAALRRRLPMVRFDNYTFTGPDGPVTLLELFGEHSQLVLYQFMDAGPDHLCPGCTHLTENVPSHGVARLGDADVAWATVSEMPIEQMTTAWRDKGWELPYASSHGTSFWADLGHGGGFSLNVFLRDGEEIFRTYTTGSRGVDRLVFQNSVQDLLPYGRQEAWEDSPAGWPQHPTYG